jgi:hypothetical protein
MVIKKYKTGEYIIEQVLDVNLYLSFIDITHASAASKKAKRLNEA